MPVDLGRADGPWTHPPWAELLQQAPLAAAVVAPDGRLVWRNWRFEELGGVAAGDVATLHDWLAQATADPISATAWERAWRATLELPVDLPEQRVRPSLLSLPDHDGGRRDIEVRSAVVGEQVLLLCEEVTSQLAGDRLAAALVRAAYDGYARIDRRGHFVDCNEALCRLLGYTAEELCRLTIAEVEAIEAPAETAARIERIRQHGADRFETQHRRSDGSVIDCEVSVSHLPSDDGQMVVFFREVTARRRSEREQQARLQFERAIGAVARHLVDTPSGRGETALAAALQAVGEFCQVDRAAVYRLGPAGERRVAALWTADGLPEAVPSIQEGFPFADGHLRDGRPFLMSDRLNLPPEALTDQRSFERYGVRAALTVPLLLHGEVVGGLGVSVCSAPREWPVQLLRHLATFAGLFAQALLRLEAEQALRDSERRYRELADSTLDAVARFDREFCLQYVNPQALRLTGWREPACLGRRLAAAGMQPWRAELFEEAIRAVLADAQPRRLEGPWTDGNTYDVAFYAEQNATGAVTGVIVSARNITAIRQAIDRLEQRDAVLAAVAAAATDLATSSSWRECIDQVLRRIGEATATERVYLLQLVFDSQGEPASRLSHEWCADGTPAQLGDPRYDVLEVQANGLGPWFERVASGQAIVSRIDQAPPEARWLMTEQGIQTIVLVPVFVGGVLWGCLGLDECSGRDFSASVVADVLQTAGSLLGARIAEDRTNTAVQTLLESSGSLTGPAYFDALTVDLSRILEADAVTVAERVDATQFRTLARVIDQVPMPAVCYETVGTPCEPVAGGEVSVVGDQAVALYPSSVCLQELSIRAYVGVPLCDAAGQVVGLVHAMYRHPTPDPAYAVTVLRLFASRTASEIVRRRSEHERQQLAEQMHQAQRLESLGVLAGGIAHDFNNLLLAMQGYAQLSRAAVSDETQIAEDLEEVLTACRRARDLVQQILAFSRKGDPDQQPLALGPVLKETIRFLRASLPATIAITSSLSPDCPVVLLDATRWQQVVMNLCTNAMQAMQEHGGHLHLELQPVELRGQAPGEPDLPPGPYVRLTVRDDGPGIAREHLPRVFEPFYTTKAPGVGSGLGLAVVHGIVTGAGGRVALESVVGQGTRVIVWLPAQLAAASPPAASRVAAVPRAGHVLLVDDEPVIVRMATRILERLGMTVEAHSQAHAAYEALVSDPGRFDLVLTDQTMPGLTGLQLAARLRDLRPGLPVVVMTGFSQEIDPAEVDQLAVAAVLFKPFTAEELAAALLRALPASVAS
ncbi:MAG: PAS domain S-box protein [Fimbriimonadaceae bacterium]|nr:PAS domain S-box protein [Fimbriimonadaceae bacterium]